MKRENTVPPLLFLGNARLSGEPRLGKPKLPSWKLHVEGKWRKK